MQRHLISSLSLAFNTSATVTFRSDTYDTRSVMPKGSPHTPPQEEEKVDQIVLNALKLDYEGVVAGNGGDSLHRLLAFITTSTDAQGELERVKQIANIVLVMWRGSQSGDPVQELKDLCNRCLEDRLKARRSEVKKALRKKYNEDALQIMFGEQCFKMHIHYQKKDARLFFKDRALRSGLSLALRIDHLKAQGKKHVYDIERVETVAALEEGMYPLSKLIDWAEFVKDGYKLIDAEVENVKRVAEGKTKEDRRNTLKDTLIGKVIGNYKLYIKLLQTWSRRKKAQDYDADSDSHSDSEPISFGHHFLQLPIDYQFPFSQGDPEALLSIIADETRRIFVDQNTGEPFRNWEQWHVWVLNIVVLQVHKVCFELRDTYMMIPVDVAKLHKLQKERDSWLKVAVEFGAREQSAIEAIEEYDRM